ncbi:MAG: trypsin-like peptidase domain-containing protein [Ilumatobacteraceae bacterium]|nr:trypsin-like peptidase domain-containing protein [Ilumatobacteraceae bacterium]
MTDSHWINQPPQLPNKNRRGRRVVAQLISMAIVLSTAGAAGYLGAQYAQDETMSSMAPLVTAPPISEAAVGTSSIAKAANVIAPSVVTIDSVSDSGEAIGTGVILSSDGEILTNAHVIEGATTVRVRLGGETEPRVADVLGTDFGNDLGLIKLRKASGLISATLADPLSIAVGDQVVAVGYALDLDGGPSVTSGIVSALNRTLTVDSGALNALIQTDAAISSGNSGGPLINMSGQLIGINTAVARGDSSTAANNIGFAISVGEVIRVVDALRKQASGTVRAEGYLGVGLSDRSDGGQGAVVSQIAPDSPAEKAGLKVDDVVLEVNGQPITGQGSLIAVVRDAVPGDEISIIVLRKGSRLTLTAKLVVRKSS